MSNRKTSKERARARLGGLPVTSTAPPPESEPTGNVASERALLAWMVQRRMAQIGIVACLVATVAGFIYQGAPGALAGLLGVYLFRDALPRQSDELDRYTGRTDKE